jgi:hypothetical protein
MSELKIGTPVRVRHDATYLAATYAGRVGKVKRLLELRQFPYLVEFPHEVACAFAEQELEIVK